MRSVLGDAEDGVRSRRFSYRKVSLVRGIIRAKIQRAWLRIYGVSEFGTLGQEKAYRDGFAYAKRASGGLVICSFLFVV